MSKLKHTPGPWIRSHHANGCNYVYKTGREYKIASTHGNEDTANAFLIASAPEMLDALIEMYIFLSDTYVADFEYTSKFKALIEKATGKSIDEVVSDEKL